jgi:hypothetical protein
VTICQQTFKSISATINLSSLVLAPFLIKLPWNYLSSGMTWLSRGGNQVMSTASQGYKTIHIECDDTDVFVLLVHFYQTLNITSELFMVPRSSKTRNVADIGITVRNHDKIVPRILPIHALTGCDTIRAIYGVGKVKAVKALQKGHVPPPLGND